MTDLEMFAEDAIYDVFKATVKVGSPISFENAFKYIVKGKPGIVGCPRPGLGYWSRNKAWLMSPMFKVYCKRYWNVELEKYVNWVIKEAA